jgi:hypothetical protein
MTIGNKLFIKNHNAWHHEEEGEAAPFTSFPFFFFIIRAKRSSNNLEKKCKDIKHPLLAFYFF